MAKQTISRTKTRGRTTTSGGARRAAPATKPRSASFKVVPASEITSYTTAVSYLMNRTDIERMRVIRPDETFKLDRMRALLEALGNPQDQIKTVHIAGTVGKGSTVAMISAMLQHCGYAVGEFTSPHLIELRERIRIGGQIINRATFTALMKTIAEATEAIKQEPTYFEVLTAMAFKYFADEAVDVALIEAGLGGRLDSTNVITPEVSVITRVAMDHERILGSTIEEIALEKAGIMKPDVTTLIFDQGPEVEEVFRTAAEKVGARLQIVNKDIEFSNRFCSTSELGPHTRVCLYTEHSRLEHLPVPLSGTHQATNCGLALAVVDMLKNCGFECPEDRVTIGLDNTRIDGRMQLVWDQPRILVDGAHNPEALGALMKCVGAHVPYDSMVCVFGCCQDKDIGAMLDMMNFGADKVIFTKASSNPRAADPADLQKAFMERSGKMSQTASSLPEALEIAARAVGREDLLCVTGSFYLVGETMKHLNKKG